MRETTQILIASLLFLGWTPSIPAEVIYSNLADGDNFGKFPGDMFFADMLAGFPFTPMEGGSLESVEVPMFTVPGEPPAQMILSITKTMAAYPARSSKPWVRFPFRH